MTTQKMAIIGKDDDYENIIINAIVLSDDILKIEKKYCELYSEQSILDFTLEHFLEKKDIKSATIYLLCRICIPTPLSSFYSTQEHFVKLFNEYVKYSKIPNKIIEIYFDYRMSYSIGTMDNTWIDVMINTYKHKFSSQQITKFIKYLHYYNETKITKNNNMFFSLFFDNKLVEKYLEDISKITDIMTKYELKLDPKIISQKMMEFIHNEQENFFPFDNVIKIIEKIFPMDQKIINEIMYDAYLYSAKHEAPIFSNVLSKYNITEDLLVQICKHVIDNPNSYTYKYYNSFDVLIKHFGEIKQKIKIEKYNNFINILIDNALNKRTELIYSHDICTKCYMRNKNCLSLQFITKNQSHLTMDEIKQNIETKCDLALTKELCRDGKTFHLINYDDSKKLTEYLIDLLNDKFDITQQYDANSVINDIKLNKLKIQNSSNIQFNNLDISLCMKYACLNINLESIKYFLENKLSVPTFEHVLFLLENISLSQKTLFDILKIMSNYGLHIDNKMINVLYNFNYLNKIQNNSDFEKTLISKMKECNYCNDYRILKICKLSNPSGKSLSSINKNIKLFMLSYESFMVQAMQNDIGCLQEYYHYSLNNDNMFVFEYLVDKFNYKPTLLDVTNILDRNRRLLMMIRFYNLFD